MTSLSTFQNGHWLLGSASVESCYICSLLNVMESTAFDFLIRVLERYLGLCFGSCIIISCNPTGLDKYIHCLKKSDLCWLSYFWICEGIDVIWCMVSGEQGI